MTKMIITIFLLNLKVSVSHYTFISHCVPSLNMILSSLMSLAGQALWRPLRQTSEFCCKFVVHMSFITPVQET